MLIIPQSAFLEENWDLEFEGITTPYETVEVGCSVVGVIDCMKVDRSDFVKKNQVLCTLDASVEKAQVNLVMAKLEMVDTSIDLQQVRYEFIKREYDRKKALYQKDAISFYERDEAETNMKAAEKNLAEAIEQKQVAQFELKHIQEIVNRLTIKSPIAGVVVERYLTSGELVNEQPILKLAQLDPLLVETIVSSRYWGTIQKDTKVKIYPEIPQIENFEGVVTIVDQIIDAESGMFGVRIELLNQDYALPAGLKCRVVFNKNTDLENNE